MQIKADKVRKGGASQDDGAAHRHPVHPVPAGEGHRPGAGRAVRGVPPDHPAGHQVVVPGGHHHHPGRGGRHLDHGGLPGGLDGAHRPGDAGHPGRPQEPGQRQRHTALRPVDGKAVRRNGQAGAQRRSYAHRPLLLVQNQPAAEN